MQIFMVQNCVSLSDVKCTRIFKAIPHRTGGADTQGEGSSDDFPRSWVVPFAFAQGISVQDGGKYASRYLFHLEKVFLLSQASFFGRFREKKGGFFELWGVEKCNVDILPFSEITTLNQQFLSALEL